MKKIYVSNSKIQGKGIFADEKIKRGELIRYIKGKPKEFTVKDKGDEMAYPNWIGIGKNKWIDPIYPNLYWNHSCNPNAGLKGKVSVFAIRNITKGEEITIDYSTIEETDGWEMKCGCGEKNCRKVIKSIQYLPEKTFDKYMPYIPTYFKKRYLKLNSGKMLY